MNKGMYGSPKPMPTNNEPDYIVYEVLEDLQKPGYLKGKKFWTKIGTHLENLKIPEDKVKVVHPRCSRNFAVLACI